MQLGLTAVIQGHLLLTKAISLHLLLSPGSSVCDIKRIQSNTPELYSQQMTPKGGGRAETLHLADLF